tara:strand:+ start:1052 stop:1213 length:162 start_codon:yes stop_codon:yes gene_type:complete
LPGGGLDFGEDKIVGMNRELTEETGAIDIRTLSLLVFTKNIDHGIKLIMIFSI